ncbi:Plant calmodulin-binding protein-related [Raphanus sativus]|uniref:Uncharacterized protein LOC108845888 n=1 Tax=Raphanus sativus TaxID=3726 RepID=A0A6J0MRQ8_RAPSA|nr:uncharacterized protein LOC108845888 [Raphanus sativus]KAJ4908682.1 Plant calmodulin-binding protein-related [Raphanus sativus]
MSKENLSQEVKEMIPDESCCSVLLPPPAAVSNGSVNMRRISTGALDKRGGKAQGQTRYRGNQTSSTHDLCKHGKRREDELVIKPLKLVKNKNVEGGGGLVKGGETLSVVWKSLHVAKRDATAADASVAVNKPCDGLRAKRSETRSSNITPSDSAAGVRMVKKTNVDVKKVSKSYREDVLKNLKDKEKKTKIDEPVRSDDALEKRVSRLKTGLSEKKESCSATLVGNAKIFESKKRISLKTTPPPPPPPPPIRPVSFKKGKVLEPEAEDPTLASIKFKKRVVQEPKLISDVNKKKKNLKDKGEDVGKMSYNNSGEGKREKVVLRHTKVEEKKKVQALFNNVIEESVNKLGEERKSSRVKALVGAFETVISLQDNDKTSLLKKKIHNKSTSSEMIPKVSY